MSHHGEFVGSKWVTQEQSEAFHQRLRLSLDLIILQAEDVARKHVSCDEDTDEGSDVKYLVGLLEQTVSVFRFYMAARTRNQREKAEYLTSILGKVESSYVSLHERLDKRTVKARYKARDAEIVRLRDEKKLTFGEVARAIRQKPEWKTTQQGNPFNADAAKKAYERAKAN